MTHICVSKLTIIASDNGLSPGRRQAIIWTNAGILSIGTVATNFNEILSEIHTFSFKKMYFKISSAKWRPFCLGLNVLMSLSLGCMVQPTRYRGHYRHYSITIADALASCGPSPSSAMLLTIYYERLLDFHVKNFDNATLSITRNNI